MTGILNDFFNGYISLYTGYNLLIQTLTSVSLVAFTLLFITLWQSAYLKVLPVQFMKSCKANYELSLLLASLIVTLINFHFINSDILPAVKYLIFLTTNSLILPAFILIPEITSEIRKTSTKKFSGNTAGNSLLRLTLLRISRRGMKKYFAKVFIPSAVLLSVFEYFSDSGFGMGYVLKTVGGYWSLHLQVLMVVHILIIVFLFNWIAKVILEKVFTEKGE